MQPTTHHPPHIYLDNTWYMITSQVYGGHRLLEPEGHKNRVRDQLKALVVEFKLDLAAWVILDNHGHVLVKSHIGAELSRFIGRWHGRTSFDLNALDNTRGRQVWRNYWDTCIRTEADYWTRFNYIMIVSTIRPAEASNPTHLSEWENVHEHLARPTRPPARG